MVYPMEILPILLMAAAIVCLPLISDQRPGS
jgi:hypothetical protein